MEMHKKLKNLRKNYHMTLKELAEKLGFAENTIHNYENGKREPDVSTLKKYAEIFNLTIDDLVSEESGKIVVFEYWINHKKIDFLLKNENVNITQDDYFALFFDPTGDGCIGWGRYKVEMYDGDVDAKIMNLACKNNEFKKYARRIIDRIWDFQYDDEDVSLIKGESTIEEKEMWDYLDVDWLDSWEEWMDENNFYIYR